MFLGTKPLKPLPEGYNESLSDDQVYWSRLKEISVFQETGNISSTDFLPVAPFNFASTCSNRLTVYNTAACEPLSVYSRFKAPVYAASYRANGSLLGTATHDGHVHFFDVHEQKKSASRNPIRSFHNAHNCRINALAYDFSMLHFASMADDGVLKLWDLSEDGSKKSSPSGSVKLMKIT
uniref:Uncharacterized protein n=1 Tax=Ditylenchus dipsaci TaxID=166011 RepID=A0A915EF73_9BILA